MNIETIKTQYPEKTIRALRDSIIHWNEVVTAHRENRDNIPLTGVKDCALCTLFNTRDMWRMGKSCIGCPIYDKTKETSCRDTPYNYYMVCPNTFYANEMLSFLQGVLKEIIE